MDTRSPSRLARLGACLATAHLVLICAVLWGGLGDGGAGVLAEAVRTYRSAAGLGTDYTFFAPAVASAVRVGFVLETPAGPRFEPLGHPNPEVMLRIHCLSAAALADVNAREVMATSLAAAALGKNTDATAVTVLGQRHDLPAPEAWAQGERARWTTVYSAQFGRRDTGAVAVAGGRP